MALPALDVHTYELVLPSTGVKVKYRPFLVKEYKILLTALETDVQEISRIVLELVDACTFNKLDINKLAHFDVEYLFLQLRAKSIGEIANLNINCDCGAKINFELNLNNAIIDKIESHNNKIMITDNIGVIMRYPKFDELVDIYDNLKTEKVIEVVAKCIDKVFNQDEVFENLDQQESIEFLNNFTKEQFDKLENFFSTMPKVKQKIDKNCNNCGKHHEYDIEGLQNFFV